DTATAPFRQGGQRTPASSSADTRDRSRRAGPADRRFPVASSDTVPRRLLGVEGLLLFPHPGGVLRGVDDASPYAAVVIGEAVPVVIALPARPPLVRAAAMLAEPAENVHARPVSSRRRSCRRQTGTHFSG